MRDNEYSLHLPIFHRKPNTVAVIYRDTDPLKKTNKKTWKVGAQYNVKHENMKAKVVTNWLCNLVKSFSFSGAQFSLEFDRMR